MKPKKNTVHDTVCPGCGKNWTSHRKNKHYCSHACRQKAYVRRKGLRPDYAWAIQDGNFAVKTRA